MDQETKECLDGIESRFGAELHGFKERLAQRIRSAIGDLRAETGQGFARLDDRLESIDARLAEQNAVLGEALAKIRGV